MDGNIIIANKNQNSGKTFFHFCILDCLFLPYFFAINVPYSYAFVMFSVLLRRKINIGDTEHRLYLVSLLAVSISTLFGCLLYSDYQREMITEGILVLTFLLYYFYFKRRIKEHPIDISPFLYLYVIFTVCFGLLYLLSDDIYNALRVFFFPRAGAIDSIMYYDIYSGSRFYFMYQDPNNICYISLAVITYLLVNKKAKPIISVLLVCAQIFIVIITFSVGGAIAAILVVVLYFSLSGKSKRDIRRIYFVLLLGIILFAVLWNFYGNAIVHSDAVSRYIYRIEGKTSEGGDTRIYKWIEFIEENNFLAHIIFGTGGITMLRGIPFSTHNGLLYMIYGFGLVGSFAYLRLLFGRRRRLPIACHLWLLPVFIGFSINILITEPKIAMIIGLLLADFSFNKET